MRAGGGYNRLRRKPLPEIVEFEVYPTDRIIEGGTRVVRERGKSYVLHVLIIEKAARTRKKRWREAVIQCPIGILLRAKWDSSWGLICSAGSVDDAVRKFMEDVRARPPRIFVHASRGKKPVRTLVGKSDPALARRKR
jgi:hypothetical protein